MKHLAWTGAAFVIAGCWAGHAPRAADTEVPDADAGLPPSSLQYGVVIDLREPGAGSREAILSDAPLDCSDLRITTPGTTAWLDPDPPHWLSLVERPGATSFMLHWEGTAIGPGVPDALEIGPTSGGLVRGAPIRVRWAIDAPTVGILAGTTDAVFCGPFTVGGGGAAPPG